MPGRKSLADAQYYAHPRNAFWPIMAQLFAIDPAAAYLQRLQLLNCNQVGLWDVYARCYRRGSLDSAIEKATAEINDFSRLFACFPAIDTVFFNGKAAEQAFRQKVLPYHDAGNVRFCYLPSTSPAHAGMDFAAKLACWRAVREAVSND